MSLSARSKSARLIRFAGSPLIDNPYATILGEDLVHYKVYVAKGRS